MSPIISNEAVLQIGIINSIPLIASLAIHFSLQSVLFLLASLISSFFVWSSVFKMMERNTSFLNAHTVRVGEITNKVQSVLVRSVVRGTCFAVVIFLCYQYIVFRVAVCGYFSALSVEQSMSTGISVVSTSEMSTRNTGVVGNDSTYDYDDSSSNWDEISSTGNSYPEDDEVALALFRGETALRHRGMRSEEKRGRRVGLRALPDRHVALGAAMHTGHRSNGGGGGRPGRPVRSIMPPPSDRGTGGVNRRNMTSLTDSHGKERTKGGQHISESDYDRKSTMRRPVPGQSRQPRDTMVR